MEQFRVTGIGNGGEQTDFIRRHGPFLRRLSSLRDAIDSAFARQFSSTEPSDMVVFSLGVLCREDFMELLVLAGNGYGIGAMKTLRGMYERLITAQYLHTRPEETEDFLDFYWVSLHRLTRAVVDTFGMENIPSDKLEEMRNMYEQVKQRFLVTICDRCGTKRINHSWSKLDFVSMARRAGTMGKFVVPAYYIPTQHIHSTVQGIISRLDEGVRGAFAFKSEHQRKEADAALRMGHLLMLNVLSLQREHFKLRHLQPALDACYADYQATWQADTEEKLGGTPSG